MQMFLPQNPVTPCPGLASSPKIFQNYHSPQTATVVQRAHAIAPAPGREKKLFLGSTWTRLLDVTSNDCFEVFLVGRKCLQLLIVHT